jgi:hypothetical protein
MATFTTTPPVGHGRELPAPPGGRQRNRTIAGVNFTQTAFGYQAQGLHIDLIEARPPYWTVVLPDGAQRAERTITRLVARLVADGHLVKDAGR